MTNRIVEQRDQLLDISKRKAELLSSIIENIEDIKDNFIFMEELEELYLELFDNEAELIEDEKITMRCPACDFECDRIASFCMACGKKLHEEPYRDDM